IPAVSIGGGSPGSEIAPERAPATRPYAVPPRGLGRIKGCLRRLKPGLRRPCLVTIGRQPSADRQAKRRSGDLALQEVAADIHADPLGGEPGAAAIRAGQHDGELVPPVAAGDVYRTQAAGDDLPHSLEGEVAGLVAVVVVG